MYNSHKGPEGLPEQSPTRELYAMSWMLFLQPV